MLSCLPNLQNAQNTIHGLDIRHPKVYLEPVRTCPMNKLENWLGSERSLVHRQGNHLKWSQCTWASYFWLTSTQAEPPAQTHTKRCALVLNTWWLQWSLIHHCKAATLTFTSSTPNNQERHFWIKRHHGSNGFTNIHTTFHTKVQGTHPSQQHRKLNLK